MADPVQLQIRGKESLRVDFNVLCSKYDVKQGTMERALIELAEDHPDEVDEIVRELEGSRRPRQRRERRERSRD